MPPFASQPRSRREILAATAATAIGALLGSAELTLEFGLPSNGRAAAADSEPAAEAPRPQQVADETLEFIRRCARPDGSYAPSPDPDYAGNSDTGLSDLAGVTYAAVLAKTMGWKLPKPERSVAFIHAHQQADGRFINLGGKMDPQDKLAVLYNTTQAVVALRALGKRPKHDPTATIEGYFQGDAYKDLPWYTTSFFPLFYAALGRPFPEAFKKALAEHMTAHQGNDGYLQDHVAATFHAAHFFRLVGERTPKAQPMIERVLHDQKADGGWNIKSPDWDVHACFDALFILRQLGGTAAPVRDAIARGGRWALSCRNRDGGFGHFPGRPSDMDAVYFNFGSLLQAEIVPMPKLNRADAPTLGWGHAIQPEQA